MLGLRESSVYPPPEISAVRHAASFAVGAVAPEMIVSIFGLELANQTVIADTDPLPTTLGGSTFTVTDSGGIERDMSLFFVSTTQVNGLIPTGTALGAATLTAKTGQGGAATAALRVGSSDQGPRQTGDLPLEVAVLAPGLFAANATGQGVAAALALRVKADDSRSTEFLFEENLQPVPLNLGDTDQVFLLLFGTGIRGFSSEVRVTVGGEDVAVLGAVPQGEFVGLDQVTAVQISWAEQRRLLKTREKASPKGCSGDQVAALDKIEIMLLSQLGLHSRQ